MIVDRTTIRTYHVTVHRAPGKGDTDCSKFHEDVRVEAQRAGRTLLHFDASNTGGRCRVVLRVKCKTTGAPSINRFARNIELIYEDVVLELARQSA